MKLYVTSEKICSSLALQHYRGWYDKFVILETELRKFSHLYFTPYSVGDFSSMESMPNVLKSLSYFLYKHHCF